jgi:hypothetical protein
MKYRFFIAISALLSVISLRAADAASFNPSEAPGVPDTVISELDEKVIVGNDTVSIIIPQRNFGRYDRGLYNYLFIPKGQWMFGLTASYGEFSADDVEVLQAISDLDFKGKQYAIRPTIGYFIRNNQAVGIKFAYTRGEADLGSLNFNAGEDLSFNLHDISYYSSKYTIGVYYRNYVGLGRSKRFAVFNEVSLDFGSGSSRFKRYYGDDLSDTRTNITEASLNFSPGVCVFIMENLSFNVSFGVFGLHMTKESQITNGDDEGSRFSSGANFRFNLFNINFGIGVHI